MTNSVTGLYSLSPLLTNDTTNNNKYLNTILLNSTLLNLREEDKKLVYDTFLHTIESISSLHNISQSMKVLQQVSKNMTILYDYLKEESRSKKEKIK